MCAHLCMSVCVFLPEGSCWLYHLPVSHVLYSSLNRKWQEANQKVQELQASQEGLADQGQRIKVSGSCLAGLTVLARLPATRGACSARPGKLAACAGVPVTSLPRARCWGATGSRRRVLLPGGSHSA